VVRAAVAPLHVEPRVSSAQTSQLLAGHPILVHEARGDWLRASGIDGYAAWVHRGYLAPADAVGDAHVEAAAGTVDAPWHAPGTVVLREARNARGATLSLGCTVRDARGAERALPLGALVEDAAADGAPRETVVGGASVALARRAERFPAAGDAVAASAARLYAGASYQWGGVTPWGADCSGFVQAVFRLHGVELPRDAWQQALAGTPIPADLADLAPADLLFFSDRDDARITHVGVALGASRMAHLSLGRGGFAVERLDATDDPYVARLRTQWCGARRVVVAAAGG
jgi:cell wall-associated NlpC family hydrolase